MGVAFEKRETKSNKFGRFYGSKIQHMRLYVNHSALKAIILRLSPIKWSDKILRYLVLNAIK